MIREKYPKKALLVVVDWEKILFLVIKLLEVT